jgi:hypothetical protein
LTIQRLFDRFAELMRVAFKMLMRDTAKYIGLILDIVFATVLIAQQSAKELTTNEVLKTLPSTAVNWLPMTSNRDGSSEATLVTSVTIVCLNGLGSKMETDSLSES